MFYDAVPVKIRKGFTKCNKEHRSNKVKDTVSTKEATPTKATSSSSSSSSKAASSPSKDDKEQHEKEHKESSEVDKEQIKSPESKKDNPSQDKKPENEPEQEIEESPELIAQPSPSKPSGKGDPLPDPLLSAMATTENRSGQDEQVVNGKETQPEPKQADDKKDEVKQVPGDNRSVGSDTKSAASLVEVEFVSDDEDDDLNVDTSASDHIVDRDLFGTLY